MRLKISYEGPIDGAYGLVGELRSEGLAPVWMPPERQRGDLADAILVQIIVTGTVEATRLIVDRAIAKITGAKGEVAPDEDSQED